jgi:hypothetical protein
LFLVLLFRAFYTIRWQRLTPFKRLAATSLGLIIPACQIDSINDADTHLKPAIFILI